MGASVTLPEEEARELEQMTRFKKDELQRWYKNFMKQNPEGKLTLEKFRDVYGKVFNSGLLSDHIFTKMDINHDGTVSFQELMLNLSITMKGSNSEKLRWAFDVYDLDGNGEITLVEMKQALIYIRDRSNASFITDAAFNREIENIFRTVDTDSNGVLSCEEFIEGMKLYPSFWNILKVQPTTRKTEKQYVRKNSCMRKRSLYGKDDWKCQLTCSHDSGVVGTHHCMNEEFCKMKLSNKDVVVSTVVETG